MDINDSSVGIALLFVAFRVDIHSFYSYIQWVVESQ